MSRSSSEEGHLEAPGVLESEKLEINDSLPPPHCHGDPNMGFKWVLGKSPSQILKATGGDLSRPHLSTVTLQ